MDASNETKQMRDHGGGLDAAVLRYGGVRDDWIDLSTGINPVPYPFTPPPAAAWTALPDSAAQEALGVAARRFWSVPDTLDVLAVPGASAAIAQIPRGRMGKPEDIAGTAIYLCSPASAWMIGQTIVIDGGMISTA